MKTVVTLVTSDIFTDQRFHRAAVTLSNKSHKVIAIGRRLKTTPKKFQRPYKVLLFKLPFSKGFLFYASYNIWAFFYLLFKKFDVLIANDLDTLPAARLANIFKKKPLIFDSHELFTDVPELINRPRVQWFWKWLEKKLVPSVKNCSTVSQSVANELKKRYQTDFVVIRNLPLKKELSASYNPNKKIIIYQGALNIGRGLERLINAMQFVTDASLQIAGDGDIANLLKKLVEKNKLEHKVSFLGRIPLEQLAEITINATIGVSLEEDLGLNYRYALPNKLFDYIQAGIPVLVSNLPEMKKIVKDYAIGESVSSDCNAYALAEKLTQMLNNKRKLIEWHKNAVEAAKDLNWENESETLMNLFNKAIS